MGKFKLMGLLALVVAFSGTAFAEVQNIRVSGDVDLKALSYRNFDLKAKQGAGSVGPSGPGTVSSDDDVNFFLSTVHLQVDADLTDNVSTTVQLINQRIWDGENAAAGDAQVGVDQAYVVLRKFLYDPLTVIAGRQDITYGTGFIVGAGLLADPEGTFATLPSGTTAHSSIGQEHSDFNSYDAIRFILDFAPVTVEGLIAKINETGVADGDEDLYGVLVNYKLDQWEAEVEPYWFFKKSDSGRAGAIVSVNDAGLGSGATRTYEVNRVHTVGLRTGASPIEHLMLSGEGAFQFGEMKDTTIPQERDRDGWAANIDARYNWVEVPWTPTTGAGWVFFSGEEPTSASNGADQADEFNAWDPMYRGSFTTFIQDFLSGADSSPNLYTTFDSNDTNSATNRHLFYLDAGASPMEDVTIWARYTHARFDESPRSGRSKHAGDEVDAKLIYDYTEDVKLALWGGWFIPGKYYDEPTDSNVKGNELAWTAGASGNIQF